MATSTNKKKNNANIPNLQALIAAGIDAKTGLPLRFGSESPNIKENMKKILRITDEQNAINRYTWYNLPDITGQELERLLYYKGQICMFYNKELKRFFYLPYALDGSIDLYGRFMSVHPVPIGATQTKEDGRRDKQLGDWLAGVKLDVLYDVILPEEWKPEMITNCTALLHDYSKQLSQTIIPRQQLNDGIVDVESDCIPFMRTALLNGTGVRGLRVAHENEAPNVYQVSAALNQAALSGQKYLPIVGMAEFQDLTDGTIAKAEEYLLAMQSLDNIRLGTYGLDNGGIFEKKARELQAEAAVAGGAVGSILQDGLTIRQHWANIINSQYGCGAWCEISETAAEADKNMDGEISDEQDGQQPLDMGGTTDV